MRHSTRFSFQHKPRGCNPGLSDVRGVCSGQFGPVSDLVGSGGASWLRRVYRLIPLDEEYPDRLRVVWRLRLSPAVKELKQLLESPEFGQTLHLQMERVLAAGARLSISDIETAWLQDADLLRSLCGGEYRQVTAIHSGVSDQGVSTASVSLAGEGCP